MEGMNVLWSWGGIAMRSLTCSSDPKGELRQEGTKGPKGQGEGQKKA